MPFELTNFNFKCVLCAVCYMFTRTQIGSIYLEVLRS